MVGIYPRLQWAKNWGADHIVDINKTNSVQAIMDITDGLCVDELLNAPEPQLHLHNV